MDINAVSQSIESTNNLVASAVTSQTEAANKLTKLAVSEQVRGAEEEGKGKLMDLLA